MRDAPKLVVRMPIFGSKADQDLKKASKLEQEGRLPQAIQAYLQLGKSEEAARLYVRIGDPKSAAELYLKAGNGPKAFSLLRGLRNREEGARLLEKHKQIEFAAKLFEEAGRHISAAELYEQRGQFHTAAELYEKGEMLSEAAQAYEKAGNPEKSSAVWERVLADEMHRHQVEPGYPQQRLLPIATKCASLKYQLGRFLEAAEILQRVGLMDKAAAIYSKIGHLDKAAKVYEDVGDFAKAAEIYDRLGQSKDAVLFKARHCEEKGELEEAARHYVSAEHFSEAGGLLWRLGRLVEAAQCFEKDGNFQWAADLYREAGQVDRAAQCDRKSGRPATPPAAATAGKSAAADKPAASRYQRLDVLGRGGMGIVYKARDTILSRVVALKVLPDELKKDREAIELLLREARAAAALNHQNIVTIYDAGREDDHYYIVMEYVEGTLLKTIIKRSGTLKPDECLTVSRQLCQGLAYAHSRRIVHRDIKPGNVMITGDRTIKIMDFGLAKQIGGMPQTKSHVMGTPYYMSPEQIAGADTDHRSDIYSLGATIFELMCGRPPFVEGDVAYHHRHSPPPSPALFNMDIPIAWSEIVLKCLEKDPEKRYNSASEIIQALEASA